MDRKHTSAVRNGESAERRLAKLEKSDTVALRGTQSALQDTSAVKKKSYKFYFE